jgi:predicted metal-binding membrane protein
MIAPRVRDYRPFLLTLALLVALSWAALFAWDLSPYGKYLDHRLLAGGGATPGGDYARLAALFVAGWTVMTIAMMLPTVIPLVLLFRRMTAHRDDALILAACLLSAYIGVWVVIGAAAHAGDLGLHAVVARVHWLDDRSWLIPAVVLLLAGIYQFTPLKHLCLEKCRSPYSFLVEHWRGRSAVANSLRLGVHHGLFCVGCCWSLMLLMFAIGAGSVVWMLGLGAVMAVEKNLPWGPRISAPLGVLLIALGAGFAIAQASAGIACAHDGGAC